MTHVLHEALQAYQGREAVYLEDDTCCLVVLEAVTVGETSVHATFRRVPASPTCEIRRFRDEGEDLVVAWDMPCPFGEQWNVQTQREGFYHENDYWDVSLYMVLRVLFTPDIVQRFRQRDMSWFDEFFS